jgi:O-antigen/teichoic acid export membrane protein
MTIKVNLLRNIIFTTLANLSSAFLLVLLIYAGRQLGAEDFGRFNFALALGTVFALATDFGLSEFTKRAVARDPRVASKYLGNVFVWKLLLSVIVFTLIVVTANLLRSDITTRILAYLLGLSALIRTYKLFAQGLMQAFERYKLYALAQITHNTLLFICGVLALYFGAGVVAFAVVFLSVKIVDIAFAYYLLSDRVIASRPRFDFGFLREIQRKALPIGIYAVTIDIYWYVDTILLEILSSDLQVGWYSAGYKLFEALLIFPIIICQAVSPQLSRLFVTDRAEHRNLMRRIFKFAFIISVVVTGCGFFAADDLVKLLYGVDYQPAAIGLRILLTGFLFSFLHFVLHAALISIDKQSTLARMSLIGLLFNVIANLVLIPKYGLTGAAVATVASEFLIFVFGYNFLKRAYGDIGVISLLWRPVLAGVLLGASLAMLNWHTELWHFVLIIPAYFAVLILLRTFDDVEMRQFRHILSFRH